MTRKKIAVVITARASYSRFKTALQAIEKHDGLELSLIVAASAMLGRYGNAIQVMERDGFKIVGGTRTTGDGYYESTIKDPEGNLIELTV